MRIDSIRLQNFDHFVDRQFELAARFNLLVGDNGSGKTSVLDGLAIGAGSLFLGFPDAAPRTIHRDEVRFRSFPQGETFTQELQFPTQIACTGTVTSQTGSWSRELTSSDGRTTRQNAAWIEEIATGLAAGVREGQPVTLPVVSYYGTGRLWVQKRTKKVDPLPPESRFLGYLDCLDPASDEKRLLAWFKTRELQALQQKRPLVVLEAVRQAILTCLNDAQAVYYDVARDELILRFADRETPFGHLSDGYRNMLAMVADIAVRCATLNPALTDRVTLQTPGLVLIDEIDLHLHPKWQRRVIDDLLRAFPVIQFVATTHSPFVIQSLPTHGDTKLLNLSDERANDYVDKSVEDITEQVQGVEVPQRSQRFLDMMHTAEEYYRLLQQAPGTDSEGLASLKEQLDQLLMPFSDDPAYQAFLRTHRLVSRIDQETDHAPR